MEDASSAPIADVPEEVRTAPRLFMAMPRFAFLWAARWPSAAFCKPPSPLASRHPCPISPSRRVSCVASSVFTVSNCDRTVWRCDGPRPQSHSDATDMSKRVARRTNETRVRATVKCIAIIIVVILGVGSVLLFCFGG